MISSVIEFQDGRVIDNDQPVKDVGIKFTSGFYETYIEDGARFTFRKKLNETHQPFESVETANILRIIGNFFKPNVKEVINKLGFVHKIGILAYGEPGCGKTSLFNFIAKTMIETSDAIVFMCNSGHTLVGAVSLASKIREIQENPIIFIADEFDRFADRYESEMKNFLDGNESVENTLFLAATNYIDEIPESLANRLSRFRLVTEIKGISDKKVMFDITKNTSSKIDPPLFTDAEIVELYKDVDYITLDGIKNKCLDKVTESMITNEPTRERIGFGKKTSKKDSSVFIDESDFTINVKNFGVRLLGESNPEGF